MVYIPNTKRIHYGIENWILNSISAPSELKLYLNHCFDEKSLSAKYYKWKYMAELSSLNPPNIFILKYSICLKIFAIREIFCMLMLPWWENITFGHYIHLTVRASNLNDQRIWEAQIEDGLEATGGEFIADKLTYLMITSHSLPCDSWIPKSFKLLMCQWIKLLNEFYS